MVLTITMKANLLSLSWMHYINSSVVGKWHWKSGFSKHCSKNKFFLQGFSWYIWTNLQLLYKVWRHPVSTYPKCFENPTFLTRDTCQGIMRIRGWKILVFRKILLTYVMDGPSAETYSELCQAFRSIILWK